MKQKFKKTWNRSKQPRKQRKYNYNAPFHLKSKLLNAHLSKELRQRYGLRSIRVRVGDKVKVMRGSFSKKEGKVEEVDMKLMKVFVTKVEVPKRDGSKSRVPLEPSNLMITELNLDDKNRKKKIESNHLRGRNLINV